MERLELQSPQGEVWLWGPKPSGRPVLLIVTGALADPGSLDHAGGVFTTVDVLRTHIPGNLHCPPLDAPFRWRPTPPRCPTRCGAKRFPTRRLASSGLSLGALVAAGDQHASNLRRLPAGRSRRSRAMPLWHQLGRVLRRRAGLAGRSGPPLGDVSASAIGAVAAPRDYSSLLTWSRRVPAEEFLIGDVPAEPRRPMERAPSFVRPIDRALLEAHPLVRTVVAPDAGHNLPVQAPLVLYDALVRMVAHLMQSAATAS